MGEPIGGISAHALPAGITEPQVIGRKVTLEPKAQALFEEEMLSWAAGPHPADGIWGKYWYDQLWTSTAFKPYVQKKVTVSSALATMVDQCMPL